MYKSLLGLGLGMAALSGSVAGFASDVKLRYQRLRPITDKNIGKQLVRWGSKRYPHSSTRQDQRIQRQLAAGQVHFMSHGPRPTVDGPSIHGSPLQMRNSK